MSFKDIAGHDSEIGLLKGAISLGRVAHAFLFAGPDGIGKKKTAIALAKALNCDGYSDDSCGICDDCARMEAGTHVNLVTVWPIDKSLDKGGERDDVDGLIRIEQVREVLNAVRFKVEKGRRVVMSSLPRVHAAGRQRFLKTRASGWLHHNTSDLRVSDLLPTTFRCQRINFRPLDAGPSRPSYQRSWVAPSRRRHRRLSGGSVARAGRSSQRGLMKSAERSGALRLRTATLRAREDGRELRRMTSERCWS